MSELTQGSRLGIFEVGELRGEGGMGKVYRARDTKLDRDVALRPSPPINPSCFCGTRRPEPTKMKQNGTVFGAGFALAADSPLRDNWLRPTGNFKRVARGQPVVPVRRRLTCIIDLSCSSVF